MQDISELIKEAKPLYLARKKRRAQIKSSMAFMVCAWLVFAIWPQPNVDENLSFWDLGYVEANTASYVENMGLPVDDYGLLQVV